MPVGAGWSLFTADFTIATPGSYQLGGRNTAAAPCFVNYDSFALQPVPEPSTVVLDLVGVLGIAAYSKRRNNKKSSDTNIAA